ncbi:tRNA 2-selenouridine synthase [Paenibacillus uliginis N3/975]|uniref:tRNA 2-selenouridine synthase n=1 Tax=Paenibacillus uliginis N3/975 TaxID=1313296 RepID=A0A1X7H864_9BACL|nr:tRNA 2-selenouridine(34) synthase MnmH [Paenibacillus uliginis]SMF81053.1 tRNA 2-selenouridine synthase [Paenibacillus uliginis N3/975]
MFQDISVEELLELQSSKKISLIDVRSPSEFKESTIPGSSNIPVFNDEERAEIGTLYKQVSVDAAKERGLEIMSAKLPAFVKEFKGIEGNKAVFCWRGGMRSRTAATVLSLMDIHVYRLQGGIKAYRKLVVETLEQTKLDSEAFVLHGFTGTGKTAVLQQLQQEGYPVIDLEGLSGHRGSIFGHIGLSSRNQKTFDSLLLERLKEVGRSPYVLIEAESKRVGKVVIPDFLIEKKEAGTAIVMDMPMEERVSQIMKDYRPAEFKDEYVEAFKRIKERIHTPVAAEIGRCLAEDRYPEAIQLLLTHYYDPKYDHSSRHYDENTQIVLHVGSIEEGLQAVKDILDGRF